MYVGRIAFSKFQEKMKKRNQIQEINNGKEPSVAEHEQPPIQQNVFNNSTYNPQIISTITLTFMLVICLAIAATLYIQISLKSLTITKAMKLGFHRILISFTIPMLFYFKNSSMRRFVCELYFSRWYS